MLRRCRMHGGAPGCAGRCSGVAECMVVRRDAPGSGVPRDNNGLYTREAIEERRQLRALMR